VTALRRAAGLRPSRLGAEAIRWVVAVLIGVVGFAVFVAAVGADPLQALRSMWEAAVVDPIGPGEVLVYAMPVVLAALAVAIPARAGLWNLGGEGQIVMGVVGATVASQAIPSDLNRWIALPMLLVGAAIVGAFWAGIPGLLRVTVNLNEAISSLLLSYVALRVLDYLVNGPWKDPGSLGIPQAEPLPSSQLLPTLDWLPLVGGGRLHLGLVVAIGALVLVMYLVRRTVWGFRLRVVGGNGEAARRAGLPVRRLVLTAMLTGGAMAGVAGFIQLSGVEGAAKGGIAGVYGFLGFLVSWLANHDPRWILVGAVVVGGIVVGGDALQIEANLPAASINILLALLLLAVLGRRGRTRGVEG
jgi:simple sugar transport system permease protein